MKHFVRLIIFLLLTVVLVGCNGEIPEIELDTPQNVVISSGVVTWDAVQDAEEYVVTVGQTTYTVTTTTFSLSTLTLSAGSYQVFVIAKSGNLVSLPSSSVTFVVETQVDNQVLQTLISNALQVIDETYTADRTEASFEEPWEYRQYQMDMAMVESYSETLLQMGKTSTVALNMFTHVYTMMNTMDQVESFSDLQVKLDVFETFGMTPEQAGLLLYNLLSTVLPHGLSSMTEDIEYYEDEYASAIANFQNFATSTEALAIFNAFQSKLAVQDLPLLVDFFEFDFEIDEYEDLMYIVAYEMTPDILYDFNNPDYMSYGTPHLELFYKYLTALKNENPQLLNQFLYNNYPSFLYPVMDYMYAFDNANYYLDRIDEIEQNMEYVVGLQLLMITQHQLFKSSLSDVVEYGSLLYDTMTPALTLAIDNLIESQGDVSMEEIFILKDEILDLLITTLPAPEDFANMYRTLFHLSTIATDINLTEALSHANYLGSLDYAMLDLFLAFVDTVDQQTVEDIMALADALYIEVPYEYTYYDSYNDQYYTGINYDYEYQMDVAIELALYIGHFIEDFLDANQTKADELTLLLEDQELEDIIVLMVESVVDLASMEMDPEEFEMLEAVVSAIIADLDNIEAGLTVFANIGTNLIVEFLATDAKFFYDIMTLQNQEFNPFDALFLTDVEALLDSFVVMNNAVVLELDLASIEDVLRMVRVPLMFALTTSGMDMTEVQFNDLFEDIVADVSQVIFNVRQFESHIVSVVSQVDLDALINQNDWNLVEDEIFMAALVITLDDILDDVYRPLVFNTIDLIAVILGNDFFLDAMDLTLLDIVEMNNMFSDDFEDLFDQIQIVAGYDFTQTTPQQLLDLQAIFEFQFQMAQQTN